MELYLTKLKPSLRAINAVWLGNKSGLFCSFCLGPYTRIHKKSIKISYYFKTMSGYDHFLLSSPFTTSCYVFRIQMQTSQTFINYFFHVIFVCVYV